MTLSTTMPWRYKNFCSDTCTRKLLRISGQRNAVLSSQGDTIINHGGKAMPSLNSNRVLRHPGAKSDERQFESKVGVPENNRRSLIDLLNARLADTIDSQTHDLQTQAKFAHWNVKGEDLNLVILTCKVNKTGTANLINGMMKAVDQFRRLYYSNMELI